MSTIASPRDGGARSSEERRSPRPIPNQARQIELGNRIRSRREELAVGLAAACRAANVNEGTWRRIETGRAELTRVRPETWARMARALRWPPSFYVQGVRMTDPTGRVETEEDPILAALNAFVRALPTHRRADALAVLTSWNQGTRFAEGNGE